jgi:hypothetical protein
MDCDLVAVATQELHLPPGPLDSPNKLNEAVDYLTAQLTKIADASTLRRKASQGHAEPWWSSRVEEAVHQTRAARRLYAASPTEHRWRCLQEACTHQLRTIQDTKTKSWRNALATASNDQRQL